MYNYFELILYWMVYTILYRANHLQCLSNQELQKELELQIGLKQEMEVAMKLLEKDTHEKQDSLVALRQQLDQVKNLNIQMFNKAQVLLFLVCTAYYWNGITWNQLKCMSFFIWPIRSQIECPRKKRRTCYNWKRRWSRWRLPWKNWSRGASTFKE